jgi:hypothetical protein
MNVNEEQPPLMSGYALGGFREPQAAPLRRWVIQRVWARTIPGIGGASHLSDEALVTELTIAVKLAKSETTPL